MGGTGPLGAPGSEAGNLVGMARLMAIDGELSAADRRGIIGAALANGPATADEREVIARLFANPEETVQAMQEHAADFSVSALQFSSDVAGEVDAASAQRVLLGASRTLQAAADAIALADGVWRPVVAQADESGTATMYRRLRQRTLPPIQSQGRAIQQQLADVASALRTATGRDRTALVAIQGRLQGMAAQLSRAETIISVNCVVDAATGGQELSSRTLPSGRVAIQADVQYDAASDRFPIERVREITASYRRQASEFDRWMGGPPGQGWLSMAADASGEVGSGMKQLARITGTPEGRERTREMFQDMYGVTLPDGPADPDSLAGLFDALAQGNREIHATIMPVMHTFIEAERNGQDGVAAVLGSDHYRETLLGGGSPRGSHPRYANTERLVEALQHYQLAQRATTPEEHDRHMHFGNAAIADYEQRQVLQPILDRVRAQMTGIVINPSREMAYTDGLGIRQRVLPNGGNYADLDTRMPAIEAISWRRVQIERDRFEGRTDRMQQARVDSGMAGVMVTGVVADHYARSPRPAYQPPSVR